MKHAKLYEDFINESVNVKYWADYHEKSTKITSVSKVARAVEDEVEEWNDNNENGKDNEVTSGDEKKVMNLAHDFFKAAGWISADVIQAMIAQESIGESVVRESKESDALASAIDKAMIKIDDSMSYTDFALAVGKILKDQYGKHTFKGFTEVLHKDLGI